MAEKWLVIDDSATIQRVIKLAFQDFDVAITEADSIQDALRELAITQPTLVITDAALAGVQSVQDFVRLQTMAPTSAFVILEGSYDHIEENQFRASGFRHFLKKPFDAGQLIAITREALGRTVPRRGDELYSARPVRTQAPSGFGMNEGSLKAPPPPPSSSKSLHEELENPFGSSDGFDLGLEDEDDEDSRYEPSKRVNSDASAARANQFSSRLKSDPSHRPQAQNSSLSHDELFASPKARAKPFFPEEVSQADSSLPSEASSKREASYNPAALNSMLEPMLRDEMQGLVRQAVEEYCRKHFAELAREYLTREIEKLSSERARLLVDK